MEHLLGCSGLWLVYHQYQMCLVAVYLESVSSVGDVAAGFPGADDRREEADRTLR